MVHVSKIPLFQNRSVGDIDLCVNDKGEAVYSQKRWEFDGERGMLIPSTHFAVKKAVREVLGVFCGDLGSGLHGLLPKSDNSGFEPKPIAFSDRDRGWKAAPTGQDAKAISVGEAFSLDFCH